MIHAYQNELDLLSLIDRNLLKAETKLLGEISPITQEMSEFKGKVLPFEDDN